ncbi:DNA alkylation repair protein [Bacillus sp. CGMCC 1.16607]|uniref:DNA alkylation repair protein n=1 Tax=Bacillus sp. CGMCC 1.16607 TaxID=3351842 RepID=UPI003645A6B2
MNTYAKELRELLLKHRNEKDAKQMEKYMRDQFTFIGLKAPVMKALFKEYIAEKGLPQREELHEVIAELWAYPERELQMAALSLLTQMKKQFTKDDIKLLEKIIQDKSWWDTIDHIAKHLVGHYFQMYPEMKRPTLDKWLESEHLWLVRSCILFQLGYKGNTDENLLSEMIERSKHIKDFFIEKAIGWALREYAKTNPEFVKEFVETHTLPKLSVREAMKHLK